MIRFSLIRVVRKIPKRIYSITKFIYRVIRSFFNQNGIIISSSLTFALVFAFIPFSIALASISSWFPFSSKIIDGIEYFYFNRFIPQRGAEIYYLFKLSFEHSAKLSIIGFLSLIASSYGIMFSLEQHVNIIFRRTRFRPFWHSLALFTIMLVATVIFVYYVGSFALFFDEVAERYLPHFLIYHVLNMLIAHAVTFSSFLLLYKFIPYKRIAWKNAFIVAGLATVSFVIIQAYFIFSMNSLHEQYSLLYGSLAVLPVFLLWIYSEVVIILAFTSMLYILEDKPHWKMRRKKKLKL